MPKHIAKRNPKRCPSHPGALIGDLINQLGLSVSYTARALDVPRWRLAAILAERSPVTAEMALRLGKAFGDGAEVWLRMQVAHDLWHAARKVELGKAVRLRRVRLGEALADIARKAGVTNEDVAALEKVLARTPSSRLKGGAGQRKQSAGRR